MIISDVDEIRMMSLSSLWSNYHESMRLLIEAAHKNDREGAMFYSAVARISIEHYFEEVEEELCRRGY